MSVAQKQLEAIYAHSDDPWDFRSSPYEQSKFEATLAALPRARYASALELGCGNGELARRIASRCDAYLGLDAVETAIAAARAALPSGRFVRAFLPCDLPDRPHDLILLSEILYFLDADGIDATMEQIDRRWPSADVVCVTWRGPSGNPLEGEAAVALAIAATERATRPVRLEPRYRIDVFDPLRARR